MKNFHSVLLSVVTIGAVASVLTLVLTLKNAQANTIGWDTYTSADGDFHFQKPEGVTVNCKDGSCILATPNEVISDPVPDMTISIQNGEVIFRTWENFEIPYFNGLVSSFEFDN